MKYYVWSGLSTDTKPTTKLTVGNLALESDTGNEFQWTGSSWKNIGTAGVMHAEPGGIARIREEAALGSTAITFDFGSTGISALKLSVASEYEEVKIRGASGNVANAEAVATLAGSAGKRTYISGFTVTGAGATAGLPVLVTVTGVLGGTLTYVYVAAAGVLVANEPLNVVFDPPLPASADNTAIVVTCPALGAGNTHNSVVAHGHSTSGTLDHPDTVAFCVDPPSDATRDAWLTAGDSLTVDSQMHILHANKESATLIFTSPVRYIGAKRLFGSKPLTLIGVGVEA